MRHLYLFTLTAALLSACADYQFTVNERVVYTPEPLFSSYDITAPALRECVKQHVRDRSITTAAGLTDLNCSHAGVESLAGLEVFTGLTRVKLTSNAIADIGPLAALTQLEDVRLDGNPLRSIMPLRSMEGLTYLSLEGDDKLLCLQLEHFEKMPNLSLHPPKHCQG